MSVLAKRLSTRIGISSNLVINPNYLEVGSDFDMHLGSVTLFSQSVHFKETVDFESDSILFDNTDLDTIYNSVLKIKEAIYLSNSNNINGKDYAIKVEKTAAEVFVYFFYEGFEQTSDVLNSLWFAELGGAWTSGFTFDKYGSSDLNFSDVTIEDLPFDYDIRAFKGSDFVTPNEVVTDNSVVFKVFAGYNNASRATLSIKIDNTDTDEQYLIQNDLTDYLKYACVVPQEILKYVVGFELFFIDVFPTPIGLGTRYGDLRSPIKVNEDNVSITTYSGARGSTSTIKITEPVGGDGYYGELIGCVKVLLDGSEIYSSLNKREEHLIRTGLILNKDYSIEVFDQLSNYVRENIRSKKTLSPLSEDLETFKCSKSNSFRFALKKEDDSHLKEYPIEEQLLSCESNKEVVFEEYSTIKTKDHIPVQLKSSKKLYVTTENTESKETRTISLVRPFGRDDFKIESDSIVDSLKYDKVYSTDYILGSDFKQEMYIEIDFPIYNRDMVEEYLLSNNVEVELNEVFYEVDDIFIDYLNSKSLLVLGSEKGRLHKQIIEGSNPLDKFNITFIKDGYAVYEFDVNPIELGFENKSEFRIHVSNGSDVFVSEKIKVEDEYDDNLRRILIQYWSDENTLVNFSTGIKMMKRVKIDHVTALTKIDKESITAEYSVYLADLDNYEVHEITFYPVTEEEARSLVIALTHPLLYIGGVGYISDTAPSLEDIGRTNIYPVKGTFIKTGFFLGKEDIPSKKDRFRSGMVVQSSFGGLNFEFMGTNYKSGTVLYNKNNTKIFASENPSNSLDLKKNMMSEEGVLFDLFELELNVYDIDKTSSEDYTYNIIENQKITSIKSCFFNGSNIYVVAEVSSETAGFDYFICLVKIPFSDLIVGNTVDCLIIKGTGQMWDIEDEDPILNVIGNQVILYDKELNSLVKINLSNTVDFQKVNFGIEVNDGSFSFPISDKTSEPIKDVSSVFFETNYDVIGDFNKLFISTYNGDSYSKQKIYGFDLDNSDVFSMSDDTLLIQLGYVYNNATITKNNNIISSINNILYLENIDLDGLFDEDNSRVKDMLVFDINSEDGFIGEDFVFPCLIPIT